MIRPLLILMGLLVFVGAGIIVFDMLTTIHRDTSIHGTVQSVNGSHVTLTDGQIFKSPVSDIEIYCQKNQRIQIETGNPNIIWCDGNPLNVSILDNLT